MYSQKDEEHYIIEYFKDRVGRFLDIGAYDGKAFSNTYRLVELGWEGVCLEPSPSVFPTLQKLHNENKKIKCIQKALGCSNGSLKFYDSNGDAISSFSLEHKEKWEACWNCKFTEVDVEVLTIEKLIEESGTNEFQFLNFDIEGMNWELFNPIDLNIFQGLELICIEHDNKINELITKLSNYGFHEIMRNGENIIFKKEN